MNEVRRILEENKLNEFLLAIKHSNFIDFANWTKLIVFFNINASDDEKTKILEFLFSWIDDGNDELKVFSLSILESLKDNRVNEKIKTMIFNKEKHTKYFNKQIFISAMELKMCEFKEDMLNNFFENDEISRFITNTDNSLIFMVSKYDMWRMRQLEEFYNNSDIDKKQKIKENIYSSIQNNHKKVNSILEVFLLKTDVKSDFYQMIEQYLIDKNTNK